MSALAPASIARRLSLRFPETIDRLKSLVAFRAPVRRLAGRVRASDEPINVLYVGTDAHLAFLQSTLFAPGITQRLLGTTAVWNARRAVDRFGGDCHVAIVTVPWPYEIALTDDERVVEVPTWLRQELQFEPTWEATRSRFRKSARGEEMRKLRKYGLEPRFTNQARAIDEFYDELYVPHARRRFGRDAPIAPRTVVHDSARSGCLMQILRSETVIAGCVLSSFRGELQQLWGGYASGDWRDVEGATGALYCFAIQYAFDRGYRRIDFASSRPVLNNGVLRTKRRWGAEIADDFSLDTFVIRLASMGGPVAALLEQTPFVVRHGDSLVGKMVHRGVPLTEANVRAAVKNFANRGLDRLEIFSMDGVDAAAHAVAGQQSMAVALMELPADPDARVVAYCAGV